jgi:RNA polymerase sigma-70 factor (ECF subfamily)
MQRINGIQEHILIERFKSGDQLAFEQIFRFYYPGLVVFASQYVMDEEDAEEIVQDFFVRLWQKKDQVNPTETLKPYLFTSIKNRSLNFLYQKKHKEKLVHKLLETSRTSLLYQSDLYVTSELQEAIRKAIGALSPKCREVFILSRINGLKNEDIANKLNLSKRTVETHVSNALKQLRSDLKDYIGLLVLLDLAQKK